MVEKLTVDGSSSGSYAPSDQISEESSTLSQTLNSADYFKPEYADKLLTLALEVLRERPGITLHSLALELANLHGLTRTSKKQVEYLVKLIKPFAGIKENSGYSPTLWSSSEQIVELIEWRGIDAFGFDRKWSELAFEEALGLAQFAIRKDSSSPIDVICEELKIKRRHEASIAKFESWINALCESEEEGTV
ncbi:hypothetical protein VIBNISFn27_340001 [Vibrio nigripulchritudo SFn27]|nr:hypothetical protein VIBNIBLFn1_740001 [Vibrio nigripulchritudo BLFn1]CCN88543.1 hypothetical protein VIBNISFn27_340001 [Vibrio nigripulchritudo SFn27]CCN95432.1 hypothetical protein VIBNIENn2_560001 [Vibrio nigripulchritudo ENn2]CCO41947.1 hypothetical protein VIBNISFn135_650001 [Vibrio nigripulchritudo SFn135]